MRRIAQRSGVDISGQEMVSLLQRLHFDAALDGDLLTTTAPVFRQDIEQEADLCEEVLRLAGYDRIPSTLMRGEATPGGDSQSRLRQHKLARLLNGLGYDEIINYSFFGQKQLDTLGLPQDDPRLNALRIRNPLGEDTALMRTTLVPDMLRVLALNMSRGTERALLYEFGTMFDAAAPTDEGLIAERPFLCLGSYGAQESFYTLRDAVLALLASIVMPIVITAAREGDERERLVAEQTARANLKNAVDAIGQMQTQARNAALSSTPGLDPVRLAQLDTSITLLRSLLAQNQNDAQMLILYSRGLTNAAQVRQQADNELAAARATIAAQAKESGDQIAADKAEAEQNCRIMVEQAQAQATRILDEANQAAEQTTRQAAEQLAQAQAEAASIIETSQANADQQRADAQAQYERITNEAQQQLDWTKQTISELLAGAKAEAEQTGEQAVAEAAAHRKQVHQKLQLLIARQAHSSRTMIRDAEARSTELNSQAEATLRAAQADAARTLHDAELAARDRLESATREAEGVLARASAQKAEADDSARRIRERVNADLTKLRQDTFEQTSLTRAEAVQLLREARNDADRVRREADEMLWKARAEVSAWLPAATTSPVNLAICRGSSRHSPSPCQSSKTTTLTILTTPNSQGEQL